MVAGFIINKFRGDPSLFIAGKEAIVQATGWPALGFVPYFSEARHLPAEDALALDHASERRQGAKLKIAVPILPQIANFDDLDPLEAEPMSSWSGCIPAPRCRATSIWSSCPGSKTTIAGLERSARRRLRYRHRRACAPRRDGARAVRRLSDARDDGQRSGWHRGTGRHGRGAWACSTSRPCCRRTRS